MKMNRKDFIRQNMFGRILDVGCEDGQLHKFIINNDMFGIDIKPKKYTERVTKGSAENMPYSNSSFDTIIAGEVIEHLKKIDFFLKETKRVLKKNGIIIISTPNKNSWINLLFHSSYVKSHHILFDMNFMESIINRYFKIEKIFCLPYDNISSFGSKYKWAFPLRKLIHNLLPESLQEEILILARKR